MSVNIRDYVSNDHVESIGEILKNQSAIIQALSIDNSKLEQELQRKDNNWNELKKYVESKIDNVKYSSFDDVLDKIKELENDN